MMIFGDIDYIAVAVAAVVAFMFGALYYGTLSGRWMKAARIKPEEAKMQAGVLATTFVLQLVMAWVLAGFVGLGAAQVTLGHGVATGFMLWLGLMATVTIINQRHEGYGWDLHLIDAAHWLGVAIIMGAVIGWWG